MGMDAAVRLLPVSKRPMEERFIAINRDRIVRARECLTPRQRVLLDVLPLLFHRNHPLLPGYLSRNTPAGVFGYVTSAAAQRAAQRIAKAISFERRALKRVEIFGLYLMGSSGTVAYSKKSDFDIWLCHQPDLDADSVAELQAKAQQIEQWSEEYAGLELHFFVFDADRFRNGTNQSLSDESSGSSQHYLLLDEFYRSGLVLAGQHPLWWWVPPDEEHGYSQHVQQLYDGRVIQPGEHINFGGVDEIPAEEFFGAAVWQLYKSVDSPYKSVLKLMLMEVYADEYPNIDLLSLRYKRAVYDGVTTLNDLDPYIQMYRQVEEYLMKSSDTQRLELLRRCFYLKVNEKLTTTSSAASAQWRREFIESLVASWGWTKQQLVLLDSKDSWNIDTVMGERRALINALTQSYRRLSQFAREYATQSGISKTDLTLLGRKLYAAFERKAGKIEFVNRGFGANLTEKHVTLENHRSLEREHWQLYSGHLYGEQLTTSTAMKRGGNALEVLAWCHFNQVVSPETTISILSPNECLSVREIRQTMDALSSRFPDAQLVRSSISDLSRNPSIRRAGLFVNFGVEALNANFKDGALIASSRTDALSYGGLHKNLARTFDLVIETTWEEVFTFRYTGVEGLFECLCEYLRWVDPNAAAPPDIQVYCFSAGYGPAITNRVQALLTDVTQALVVTKGEQVSRYLIEIEHELHLLEYSQGVPTHRHFRNEKALLRFLGVPSNAFATSVFDENTLIHVPLRCIFDANRKDHVQIFVRPRGRRTTIYVLDEQGSLFVQHFEKDERFAVVDHFVRFLRHTSARRRQQEISEEMESDDADVHMITNERENTYRLRRIQVPRQKPGNYFRLQVIVNGGDDGNGLTIYCEDSEFSTLEYGDELFKRVAEHVLRLRNAGERYPIYITDIDVSVLSAQDSHSEPTATVQYLVYKREIEKQLNRALQSL